MRCAGCITEPGKCTLLSLLFLLSCTLLLVNVWNLSSDTGFPPVTQAAKVKVTPHVRTVPDENRTTENWKQDWRSTIPTDRESKKYLEEFEKKCESRDSIEKIMKRRKTDLPDDTLLCPCVPVTLVGRVIPDAKTLLKRSWNASDALANNSVMLGGSWKPPDCLARRRVAVVIPCRDREPHLRAVLAHLHPILQRHLLEYRIFVVEQILPHIYSKSSSMDAGFLEADKMMDFDCVMFHDVDLLEEDDRAIVYCGDNPLHYAYYVDRYRYRPKYGKMFGGMIVMTKEQFVQTNGFSTLYFGWGGEDDDFLNRVKTAGYSIDRPPAAVSRYSTIRHSRDSGNPANPKRARGWSLHIKEYRVFGLNSIQYDVTNIILDPLYTRIGINLRGSTLPKGARKAPQQYLMIYGSCQDNDNKTVIMEESLSQVSCQHLCDMNTTCRAYVYYRLHHNSCVHLNALCRMDYHVSDAITHVKDTGTIQINKKHNGNETVRNESVRGTTSNR